MKSPESGELGFLSSNFLPNEHQNLGLLTKGVRGTRELLVGWAEDIPVLNIGTWAARKII